MKKKSTFHLSGRSFYGRPLLLLLVIIIFPTLFFESLISLLEYLYGPLQRETLFLDTAAYHDFSLDSLGEELLHRIAMQPFNLVASIIFFLAVFHMLFSHQIAGWARSFLQRKREGEGLDDFDLFLSEMTHFLSEVEIVFGLWAIFLFIAMSFWYSQETALKFFQGINFDEPVLIFVVMVLAGSYPTVRFAETVMHRIALFFGKSLASWWFSILMVGTLLGSLITEPAAMTLCALLLRRRFYRYHPSTPLAYATLGLLFTNISVGGVLTDFAAPPVLMVAKPWQWSTSFMFTHFGVKAIIGILLANLVYFFLFRRELREMDGRIQQSLLTVAKQPKKEEIKVPSWITVAHLLFLWFTVNHSHYPVIFFGGFLLFLGFYQATIPFQKPLSLKSPLLVAFFLGGLLVHAQLQGWWLEPVLMKLSPHWILGISLLLTSFNDNAAMTALAATLPDLSYEMKYAIVSGAVAGGGLTLMANAPNPAGYTLLRRYFRGGVSPLGLLAAASVPTLIMAAVFSFYLYF